LHPQFPSRLLKSFRTAHPHILTFTSPPSFHPSPPPPPPPPPPSPPPPPPPPPCPSSLAQTSAGV
jgi:hypothetical protein